MSAKLTRVPLTSGAIIPASSALSTSEKKVPSDAAAPRWCGNRSSTSSWIGANTSATVKAMSIGPITAGSSARESPPGGPGRSETSSRFSAVVATTPRNPTVIRRLRGILSAARPTTQDPLISPAISGTNSTQKSCSPSPSSRTTKIEAPAMNRNWAAKPKAVAAAIRSITGERPTCSRDPSRDRTRTGVRSSGGSVSGRVRVSASTTMPYRPTPANAQRQSPSSSSQPPMIGAIAGARAKIIITRAMRRCASAPSNRSRITTRETIVAAPALMPCSIRSSTSEPRLGAMMLPNMPIR